jgi:hypothetical protein
VDHLGVVEREPPRRGLDRIDVADQVGDGDVGRRELLVIALVPVQPLEREVNLKQLEVMTYE